MKKLLSLLLSMIMLLSVVPMQLGSITAQAAINNGDIISYGSWPQSEVTDSTIKTALKKVADDSNTFWFSYDWTKNGNRTLSDPGTYQQNAAYYTDTMYNGSKYRIMAIGSSVVHGSRNGYTSPSSGYNYYYFKWEPIKWKVVNGADGTLLAQNVLLADNYSCYLCQNSSKYYQTSGTTNSVYYAGSYASSQLRNVLNGKFYKEAFNDTQRANIKSETNTNNVGGSTSDYVWVPRQAEITRTNWGFVAGTGNDANRKTTATAYAKACGAYVFTNGTSPWWLRDGYKTDGSSKNATYIADEGYVTSDTVTNANKGIRPCIHLTTLKADTTANNDCLASIKKGDAVHYGNYPQTKVTSSDLIANLGNVSKTWETYRYYSGSGLSDDGKMQGGDCMEYADFMYNGTKYRAVRINQYRPYSSAYKSGDANKSYQDEGGNTQGNTYYFRYEPIKWTVVDADKGLLMAYDVLDSQEYQSMTYKDTSDGTHYYRYKGSTTYASRYAASTIRYWLCNDFNNTAFNTAQKNRLQSNNITCTAADSKYQSTVADSIVLPSKNQASYMGTAATGAKISDYAKCMGHKADDTKYLTHYATNDSMVTYAALNATTTTNNYVEYNYLGGIRPVICVNIKAGMDYTTDTSYLYSVKRVRYSITVNKEGSGTVTGAGTKYRYDDYVNLSATPATGYSFKCWKNESGTELNTTTYPANWWTKNVTGSSTYTAVFTPKLYDLVLTAGTGGSIGRTSTGTWYTGSHTYNNFKFDSYYEIFAKPDTGYRFDHWENVSTGASVSTSTSNECRYTFKCGEVNKFKAYFTKVYTITAKSNNTSYGTVTGGGTYDTGKSVTLTATPKTGYKFDAWYENGAVVSGAGATYTFTANKDRTLEARFVAIPSYTVTLTNTTGGTVSGAGSYQEGASCTAKATANSGYTFVGWYEGSTLRSSNASYTFTVTKNITLQARFTQKATYKITATANPTAGGTITGAGTYEEGASCTLKATANTGYTFGGWFENNTRISTNATLPAFTVNKARTLEAKFVINDYTITVSADPAAGGTVTGGGKANYNTSKTVTATAKTGYTFDGWYEGGSKVSSSASYTFTVTKARTLVAKFKINAYTIAVSADPSEGGSVSGGGSKNYGTSATVTATPKAGYAFDGWYEGSSKVSSSASYTFTVSKARTLVAKFKKITYTVKAESEDTSKGAAYGSGTYDFGAEVTVEAVPSSGYKFLGWYDGVDQVSTESKYSFTAKNITLTAKFMAEEAKTFTVTLNKTGEGEVAGGGICESGKNVSVLAAPASGYKFSGWYKGDTKVSDSAAYTFSVTGNITLTAKFIKTSSNPSEPSNEEIEEAPVDTKLNLKAAKIKSTSNFKKKTMTISFAAVSGATNYQVRVRKAGAKTWNYGFTDGKTSYVVKKVAEGSLYDFQIRAVKKNGNDWVVSAWSNVSRRFIKKTASVKVAPAKTSVKISWKKDSKASGYLVYVYTDKACKKKVTSKTLKGASKNKVTIKKLKRGKTYYYRIRSYKTKSGKKYLGIFTTTKSFKTK